MLKYDKEEENPLDNTDDYKKVENVITQSENKKDRVV